jgi:hypothetical protein
VTPFDQVALVAMLLADYPAVSSAAFARARVEQPAYFAGGVIFGSKGDKLRLPDGREFDCIVAAGGPAADRRWQCALIDPNAPGVDDPFALDDGPLAPLELEPVTLGGGESFEAMTARAFDDLRGADDALAGITVDVAAGDIGDRLEGSYRDNIEPAAAAHDGIRAALDEDDPIDVVAATGSHDGAIDQARNDYTEPAPPDSPEPDPGSPPGDTGDGPTPGPPQA